MLFMDCNFVVERKEKALAKNVDIFLGVPKFVLLIFFIRFKFYNYPNFPNVSWIMILLQLKSALDSCAISKLS